MLAEFLADRGGWTQVMPGARACLFSLEDRKSTRLNSSHWW